LLILAGAAVSLYGTRVPGRSYKGPFEPLSDDERAIREELQKHVAALAGKIGERNLVRYTALNADADYVRDTLREMGYAVREQSFDAGGLSARNIEAELPGSAQAGEIVVIGAHYDSVIGSPGANDNASGVAAMLALARLARAQSPPRTIRFVAFVNEEPPFFQSWRMGSRVYARECRQSATADSKQRGDNIVAMLSLETIGYYSDASGSQAYPFPFRWLYPDTGNFIAFVSNISSRGLLHKVVAAFRERTRFPSEGAAAPEMIPGISWSDHWSFWKEGYPAIMVTDTAFYRYGYYHTQRDLPEQLSYDQMARVVGGLAHVVNALAEWPGIETKRVSRPGDPALHSENKLAVRR
jgi:Zn-dependent M28 family amino/carboxypeptidase